MKKKRKSPRKNANDINLKLINRIKAGDEKAINELILYNKDYLYHLAKSHRKRLYPMDVDDIYQTFCMILLECAYTYKENPSVSFMQYSSRIMYLRVYKMVGDYLTIRLPVNFVDYIAKINKLLGNKSYDYNERDVEYISDLIDELYPAKARYVLEIRRKLYDPMRYYENTLDDILNVPVCFEDEMIHNVYVDDLKSEVEKLMNDRLTNREIGVLKMRFGIGEYKEPMTLKQTAKEFNVTTERIRQIESKALIKLRKKLIKEAKNE